MLKDDLEQTNTPVIAMLEIIEHLINLDRFYCNTMNQSIFLSGRSELILRSGDLVQTATTIVVSCRSLLECYIKFLSKEDSGSANNHLKNINDHNLNLFCKIQKELRDALVHGRHNRKTKINEFSLDDYNGEISRTMSAILKETKHENESYSNQLIYCTFKLIKYLSNKYLIEENKIKSKQNELIMERIDTLEENNLGAILFQIPLTHPY